MVIFTTKLTMAKKLALLGILAVLILVVVLAVRGGHDAHTGVRTNAQRVAYLADCGLTVETQASLIQETRLPEAEDELFLRYNSLQLQTGYDLTRYAGKAVKRCVYQVLDSPDTQVTLLLSGSRVIGGDVTCTGTNAWMEALPQIS